MNPDPHGLMRRARAAAFLDCSVSALDNRLVPDAPQPVAGKIRFVRLWQFRDGRGPVRCRVEDVLRMAHP